MGYTATPGLPVLVSLCVMGIVCAASSDNSFSADIISVVLPEGRPESSLLAPARSTQVPHIPLCGRVPCSDISRVCLCRRKKKLDDVDTTSIGYFLAVVIVDRVAHKAQSPESYTLGIDLRFDACTGIFSSKQICR